MAVVSSIICDASRLDTLTDGAIVRLKTDDGTRRCAVAESAVAGRVWLVSGASGAWTSEDLLDLGTVIVLYLPEN